MTKEEMINWIAGASYVELLRRWRFEPIGSPWFQGEVGEYYTLILDRRRQEVGDANHAQSSKNIGWK